MKVKVLLVHFICSIIIIVEGQQTFERSGDNYHARVAIHREKPYSYGSQFNAPSRPKFSPYHPWRQGERITKQEVVQNLARALLSRKKPKEEIQKEKRKQNEENLREYALYQARKAKGEIKDRHNVPKPVLPPGNAMMPPYPASAPVQPGVGQREYEIQRKVTENQGQGNLPPQKTSQQQTLVKKETRYSKTVRQRPQPSARGNVRTREFMRPNSFQ